MLKIFLILIILKFAIFDDSNAFSKTNHIEKIQSTPLFKTGIIGENFNILNSNDLIINACMAPPEPFVQKFSEFPYWQCFEINKTNLLCDGHNFDKDSENFLTVLVLSAKKNQVKHEYISRRAISYHVCQNIMKDWKKFTKNEKHVCVSGPFTSLIKKENNQPFSLWIFDKFKTKKGCSSYFYGDCSLKYQIKHGCNFKNY